MRRGFVRGLQVIVSAIGGNDVVIATSHPGANEFYCFVRKPLFSSPAAIARRLEREARDLLRTIRVDPLLLDDETPVVRDVTESLPTRSVHEKLLSLYGIEVPQGVAQSKRERRLRLPALASPRAATSRRWAIARAAATGIPAIANCSNAELHNPAASS